MRSVMQHVFSQVPKANIPRSVFDRSHAYKTTFNAGWLVPIYVDEVLPGDTFSLSLTTFARLSTPLHPIMDNMFCDVFFFAVPLRLLWDNFVRFMGEQDNPSDTTSYLVPRYGCTVPGYQENTLEDYMGLPTKVNLGTGSSLPNALHLRAYHLIYNQWFRDQNLQNSVYFTKSDGPDTAGSYVLQPRGKRHDYFTSCLPWPQKGVAVSLPLGTTATVKTNASNLFTGVQPGLTMQSTLGGNPSAGAMGVNSTGGAGWSAGSAPSSGGLYPANLYADLSTATAATINQLRQAFQIQKIYERDARGGTRYTELIQSHFGVTSPDARLQRPEYLGGGSTPINVNPIAQTSGSGITGATTPQGNLAAMGTWSHRGCGFSKSFTEHCVLIGLINVRGDLTYQQGMNRMWSRQTRFDFYWPALAHIGEQAVLNQEIYAQGTAVDQQVFGYQERYGEYRYKPSIVTGQFRSNCTTPLDSWHLAESYSAVPVLASAFIQSQTLPVSRIVAVPSQPHFLLDCFFSLKCARPMPLYGVPGNIDRF